MAKKAARKFLCIGGPLSGQAIDLAEAARLEYRRYNRAGTSFPAVLLIHCSVIEGTLQIAAGREKREEYLSATSRQQISELTERESTHQ